ncbi:MAG: DUF2141 domain-containing protein [Anderseniella sp.]
MFKTNSLCRKAAVVAGIMTATFTTPAWAGDIFVSVTSVRSAEGTVLACLWFSGWGFPNCEEGRDNIKIIKTPALQGTVNFTFEGVPDGTYAISVAHDQNNDGVLERHKFLKYPLEGAGLSNYNEPPRFVPLHHSATFKASGQVTEIRIPMHYPPE